MRVSWFLVSMATVAAAASACAARTAPAAPVVTPAGVRFVLVRGDAHTVALAGSFNRWSASSHLLVPEKSGGRWTIVVPLPPGEHVFMYVVDGTQWISPPLAEDFVDDGFGAKNGVVVVGP